MPESDLAIFWSQTANFIRQLNHDLRNHLNAFELQSAFLGEIVEGDEAKSEVKRLRGMNAEMSAHLHRISVAISPVEPHTIRYRARDFVDDLRAKLRTLDRVQPDEIEWQLSLGEETIEIDPHLLLEAFGELFLNANQHARGQGPLVFSSAPNEKTIVFQLREPKTEPVEVSENWGSPLARCRHGHYGLGLFHARNIFEHHHGTFHAQFDPAAASLFTTVVLPAAAN